MEKLAIIVCAAPGGNALSVKPWMPQGAIGELAAMVRKNSGWSVLGWDEMVNGPVPPAWLNNAALVMLTGLTPSFDRMNQISNQCKEADVSLIAGGRDVIGWSREPGGLELLAERFPSFCTTHMSCDLMANVLSDCASGHLQQHYYMPPGVPCEFVVPDRSIISPTGYFAPYALRSSVGCNRNCSWCTVGGQGQFYKPIDMLKAELETFRNWFFVDVADSFAGNPDLTAEVLDVYASSGMNWGTEATVADLLGHDGEGRLIRRMKRAGCVMLYVGVESITRQISGNKVNREQAEAVIRRCQREGIIVIGSLIFDAIGDETEEEINDTVRWATRWLDFAQFSLTALLPGCALRKKALREGTIIETDWSLFDGAHPTMKHVLSKEERSNLLDRAYRYFSTLPRIVRRALRAPWWLKIPVLYSGIRYRSGISHI